MPIFISKFILNPKSQHIFHEKRKRLRKEKKYKPFDENLRHFMIFISLFSPSFARQHWIESNIPNEETANSRWFFPLHDFNNCNEL